MTDGRFGRLGALVLGIGLCAAWNDATAVQESPPDGVLEAQELILRHPDSQGGDVVLRATKYGGIDIACRWQAESFGHLRFVPRDGGMDLLIAEDPEQPGLRVRVAGNQSSLELKGGARGADAEFVAMGDDAYLSMRGASANDGARPDAHVMLGAQQDDGYIRIGGKGSPPTQRWDYHLVIGAGESTVLPK